MSLNLVSVTIPNSVTSIGNDVFTRYESLTFINYRGSERSFDTLEWKEKERYRLLVGFSPEP